MIFASVRENVSKMSEQFFFQGSLAERVLAINNELYSSSSVSSSSLSSSSLSSSSSSPSVKLLSKERVFGASYEVVRVTTCDEIPVEFRSNLNRDGVTLSKTDSKCDDARCQDHRSSSIQTN